MDMKKIDWFIKKELLSRDDSYKSLSEKYFEKARNNLVTMNLLENVNTNKDVRELLSLPAEYNSKEWIVICGYYAMYSASLALVSKLGFKSENHAATLFLLEEFFVKKKLLSEEEVLLLRNAEFQKEQLEKLSSAREEREKAQYSVTENTTNQIAEKIKKDAYEFVNKCEQVLAELKK